MKISKLFKIGEEVVFYNPTINSRRNEIYNQLKDETLIGYDISGNALSTEDAIEGWLLMCSYPTSTTYTESVYRNINLSKIIISVVRTELKDEINPLEYITELQTPIGMIQTGLFVEAAMYLQSMIPNAIITADKLNNWSSMLMCSNGIVG